jgi:hypothetical protein
LRVFIYLDNADKTGLNLTYAPVDLFNVNMKSHGVYDDGANILKIN